MYKMVTIDEEDRLLYLSGSGDFLPSSYIKLRSHLNIHSSLIAEQHNLKIFKSRMRCCPYCYTTWTCDTSSFQLLPSKNLKTCNKKETREKINSAADQKTAQESRNVLVLKCRVCTRKSSFSLVKRKKTISEKVKGEENVTLVKKKRKKKDKTCGLHVNLGCKTVAPQPFIIRKKSGLAAVENSATEILQENPRKLQSKSPVILPNSNNKSGSITQKSKNLITKPLAPQALSKLSRKKDHQKLIQLKKGIKKGGNVAKKTLKDFLTLI